MPERVVFLHLPKTGGTTLHQLLAAHFASEQVCPKRGNFDLSQLVPGDLDRYRLYSGHFDYESVLRYLPRPMSLVTMLREPKARLLSAYYFARSHKLDFILAEPRRVAAYLPAKQLGLAEFLQREAERLSNLMVRRLAGAEGAPAERLRRAKERLRDMAAFGLTERMEESAQLIFARLGLPPPAEIPRAMAFATLPEEFDHIERVEKEPVTPDVERYLDELTRLDRELYDFALQLLDERLAAEPAAAIPPPDLHVSRPLRVLYDISVLGYGQLDNRCRTGVFRVIENVARHIVASGNVELGFCATQHWRALDGARDYLEAHRNDFPDVPLVTADAFDRAWRGLTGVHAALDAIDADVPIPGASPEGPAFVGNLRASLCKTVQLFPDLVATLDARSVGQYDIFHSTFYPVPGHLRGAPGVAMFATIFDLIPLILPELFAGHGNNEVEFQRMVNTLQALRAEDHVLCISNSVRDDLLEYSPLDPDRVHVTHLAANPAVFFPVSDPVALAAARARFRIGEGPYILGVSTLEPRKNFDHLIRCYVRLVRQERLSDLRLVLVGAKGWNYEPIFEELRRAGLSDDRVVFTGYVPDVDLAPLYSGALAFVYPSLYEGFGLPPLEAMQCGTPVITSNTSSLPEVVGEAGIMVDPRDADALCAAMLRLYRESDLRAELAQRSLDRAGLFTWERTAEQTIAAYRAALQQG